MDEPSPDESGAPGLRRGWTTGTCASAAAKAAAIGLVTGVVPSKVDVALPGGRRVQFDVEGAGSLPVREGPGVAIVVKDAGDDPDCTDGARMTAEVSWAHPAGADRGVASSELRAGTGVGTITKPGLGLDVGAPAINPVPRRMILDALAEVTDRPVVVTFSVPGGERMAERTTNARLGIVGGISILGTTGIVKPFSTAAYRASVVQQIDVAAAQGFRRIILCTGSRSEQAAVAMMPGLDQVCFVEVGDFTGIALRRCASKEVKRGRARRDGREDRKARGRRDDDPLPQVEGRHRASRVGRTRDGRAGRSDRGGKGDRHRPAFRRDLRRLGIRRRAAPPVRARQG